MLSHLETRRLFLQKGIAMLAAAPTVPAFLDTTVAMLTQDVSATQQPTGKDDKILVIVQLSGGNDGLSTVIPYADDAYQRSRRQLAFAPDKVLKINDYVGLNPEMAGLKAIYDDGRMGIVQGVGYPNPNRSHFRSMDVWQSGEPEKEVVTNGWLGRYFDNTCSGTDPHAGVSIGDQSPLAMRGSRIQPLSFERPESYRYNGPDQKRYLDLNERDGVPATQPSAPVAARRPLVQQYSEADQLNFLHRTAMDAQVSSDSIRKMTSNYRPSSNYPGGEFGQGLRTVAAMIAGGLPTRVYYVSLGGFDTHANQAGRHSNLMQQFSNGTAAFWKDMKEQKNDDRVLMLTFSEFGRRVETNASGGTDHGAAAPLFLIGPKIRPGLLGKHPSLTNLDQGDLKYGTDFRSVYATVLQNWLGTPSKPVLGKQYELLPILKA